MNELVQRRNFIMDYGIDVENRVLYLDGDIDEDTTCSMIRGIDLLLDEDNVSPITVKINSCGGDVYEGFAIYDALNEAGCPIHTICTGKAMSMALIIFMVGVERTCIEKATFMNHSASGIVAGRISEMKNDLKENDRLENLCYTILAEKTNHTKKWWEKESEKSKDCYYDYQKALKLGIVTA